MGLITAVVDESTASLSAAAGQRIIAIAFSRGGSESFAVTPNAGGATWVNRVEESTLPANDAARRSLAVAELTPTSLVDNVSFTADWAGDLTVGIWLVVEEGDGWDFAEVAVADSGTNTVTTLGTGDTATVSAGDILLVAAAAMRGGGTAPAAWATTDINPALVGGGNALLDVYDGRDATAAAGAAGYASLTGQGSQVWSDTVTIDTARMTTVALVVWVAATGAVVDLAGTADTVSDAAGTLSTTRPLAGTADAVTGAAGTLSVTRPLAGSGDGAGDATGSLSRLRALTGAADSVADSDGSLAVARNLAGTGDAVSDGVGDLTVEGPNEVAFAGTADTASDAIGTLSVLRPLAGFADAVSDAIGSLQTGVDFLPELTGSVVVQGLAGSVTVRSFAGSATVQGLAGKLG